MCMVPIALGVDLSGALRRMAGGSASGGAQQPGSRECRRSAPAVALGPYQHAAAHHLVCFTGQVAAAVATAAAPALAL